MKKLRQALAKPIITDERYRIEPNRQSALDLVWAPHSIQEESTAIRIGDTWACFLEARAIPSAMTFAWITGVQAMDRRGVFLFWRSAPISDYESRQLLEKSEQAAKLNTLATTATSPRDVEAEQGVDELETLRADILAGRERLVVLHIIVVTLAPTREALRALTDEVQRSAGLVGFLLDPIPFHQQAGYRSLLFGMTQEYADVIRRFETGGRVAASLAPVVVSPPRQPRLDGVVWGVHARNGQPIFWDRRQATNPHALILAASGSGKTYTVRSLIIQELLATDERIFILDPKMREYATLTRLFDGDYVVVSEQSGVGLNPFDVPIANQSPEERRHTLDSHAVILRSLIVQEIEQFGTHLVPRDYTLIEQTIRNAYRQRGLYDLHDGPNDPTQFPTFSDVQSALESTHPTLAGFLDVFTQGLLGSLINRPSRQTTARLVGVDISSLLASNDPLLLRVIPSVVMIWLFHQALVSPHGAHIIADEAHVLLSNPTGAQIMERIVRIGRSLGLKATIISQDLSDYSDILRSNTDTKLILGGTVESARSIGTTLSLPNDVIEYLTQCRLVPGVGSYGLLIAGAALVPILVQPWFEPLHTIAQGKSPERGS